MREASAARAVGATSGDAAPSLCRTTTDVQAAIAGDRAAFGRLATRHVDLVRRVVLAEIRWRDDAGDCVQEALTRALRDIGRLRDPSRFTPWLLAIARNVAVDHRRAWLREAERSSSATEHLEQVEALDPGPDDLAAARSIASMLRSVVVSLPEREATALALATYHDLRPAEIGRVLGTTPGNAKVIVHRARRRLRSELVRRAALAAGQGCGAPDQAGAGPDAHLDGCAPCRRVALRTLQGEESARPPALQGDVVLAS